LAYKIGLMAVSMPRLRFLMEQLERVQRFAASLTNAADRDRLN
jgi:hypothetical protein